MKVFLIRHGETAWNEARRYQGSSDVPLNEAGREQARRLAHRLAGEPLSAVYASDLARASETARIIAAPHRLEVRIDADLRELDFGAWEGLAHEEAVARDGEQVAAWWEDPLSTAPPDGESLGAVLARTRNFLARIQAEHGDEETLAVVSHVGPIKALLADALHLDLGWHWQIRLDRASVTTLAYYGRGAILLGCNDTCHLRGELGG